MDANHTRLLGIPALAVVLAIITGGSLWAAEAEQTAVGGPTRYEADVERLDKAIRAAEEVADEPGASPPSGAVSGTGADPGSLSGSSSPRLPRHPVATLRRLHLLHRRALLTGEPADFQRVEAAVGQARGDLGQFPDFLLLSARLHLNRHRVGEARADLERLGDAADHPVARILGADAALQEGRVSEAQKVYRDVDRVRRTWDNLARLGDIERVYGDPAEADRFYLRAQDEITAKEMRAFAWVEVQRGVLDLERGRTEDALRHYRRADSAYSGYWLVEEHIAEALAALGQYPEAISRYEALIRRSARPELRQALGDLHLFLGDARSAAPWHREALAAYRASASRDEPQYLHHLAGMYADSLPDAAEAVHWARKDVALRPNQATRDMLAWALYRAGDFTNALAEIRLALDTGARNVHLYTHASQILGAFGRLRESREFQEKAAAIHPRHLTTFHLHR